MALTRKMLKAMGIEDDKAEQIIEANAESIEALRKQRDQYKADADKLPDVQKELDTLKEAAEKNANNPYKAQYEDLKKEFEDYKADITAKETKAKKTDAYRRLLKEAKISDKRMDSILKLSPVDDIELDEKGEVKDADKVKEAIKKEWSDFIVTEETHGAQQNNPLGGNGNRAGSGNGGGTKSRAAMIASQYQASLYGTKEAK